MLLEERGKNGKLNRQIYLFAELLHPLKGPISSSSNHRESKKEKKNFIFAKEEERSGKPIN